MTRYRTFTLCLVLAPSIVGCGSASPQASTATPVEDLQPEVQTPQEAPAPQRTETRTATSSAKVCAPKQFASGLELVVLGSGGPKAAGRAGSGYLVVIDGVPRLLIDVGPGTVTRLGELGISQAQIDTILLTHLHIDHAGDLPGVIKSRDISMNKTVKYQIYGPGEGTAYPKTSDFVKRVFGSNGAFAYLSKFRNRLELETKDVLTSGSARATLLEQDGLVVHATRVVHGDVPALAYRVEYGGAALVATGDLTSTSGSLAAFAKGVDLLVYDTAVLDPPDSPKELYALHTAPTRIGQVASKAGAGSLVLSHITPPVEKNQNAVVSSVKRSFDNEVTIAHDCMHVVI